MTPRWPAAALLLGALAAPAVPALSAAPAAPAAPPASAVPAEDGSTTGYRYWSFWVGADDEDTDPSPGAAAEDAADADGGGSTPGWRYATAGPGTTRPADGDVLGFRFAVSANSSDGEQPRPAPDFAEICGSVAASEETRRVALVIDFGTAEDAREGTEPPGPRSGCATLADGATAADALAAEAEPLRYHHSGLLCAIEGYPAEGCGEPATRSAPPPSEDTEPGPGDATEEPYGGPAGPEGFGMWLGVAAVAVVAMAALGRNRRGRRHDG